jgi:hypothetical protein
MPFDCKQEIQHLREFMEQHFALNQLAIDKAEMGVDKRLEGMNEFRAQQADVIAKFATNERLNEIIRAIELKADLQDKTLDDLNQWKANIQGRMAVIIILWPLLIGVVTFILSHVYK